jgi:hypothetical protein
MRTGRVTVRFAGDPAAHVEIVRRFDPDAIVERCLVTLALADSDRETPTLLAALTAAGALIVEVRPEMPALEDVYLHLTGGRTS